MGSFEQVIYIQGVGDEPVVQSELPERLAIYGLSVDCQSFDWTKSDYEQRRDAIIGHIKDSVDNQNRVSILGASGGGKAAMDMYARHPSLFHRVVTISTKFSPYLLKPAHQEALPNLVASSDVLASSLGLVNGKMLEKVLCVHPVADRTVAPEEARLAGASELVVPVEGHIAGITYALTDGLEPIAAFIKQD